MRRPEHIFLYSTEKRKWYVVGNGFAIPLTDGDLAKQVCRDLNQQTEKRRCR